MQRSLQNIAVFLGGVFYRKIRLGEVVKFNEFLLFQIHFFFVRDTGGGRCRNATNSYFFKTFTIILDGRGRRYITKLW